MIGREEKLFQIYHTNVNIDELLTEWLTQMLYSDLRKNIKVSTGRRISNSFFTYLRSLRKGSTSTKAEAATNLATNTLGVAATGTAAFTLIVGAAVAEAAAGRQNPVRFCDDRTGYGVVRCQEYLNLGCA